jgi:hypothetical protein
MSVVVAKEGSVQGRDDARVGKGKTSVRKESQTKEVKNRQRTIKFQMATRTLVIPPTIAMRT